MNWKAWIFRMTAPAGICFFATALSAQVSLIRGPYLQSGSQSSMVVRWNTNVDANARVRFGAAPGNLPNVVDDSTQGTEHEITLSGLAPATRYFYSVGTSTETLAGNDADHVFVTTPPGPSVDPVRIWVIGDSGTAHQQQLNPGAGEVRDAQGVRDAYFSYAGLGAPLVTAGATFSYLDDGSDQGSAWRELGFDDSGWSAGAGELGYGDGDEATVVNCGPSAPACNVGNFVTTYFRHVFNVADASAYTSLTLSLLRDDGAIAYLNGTEVFRTNMPTGPVFSSTTALSALGGTNEHIFHRARVDSAFLADGMNVLAVEVHQRGPTSSDISLHAELFAQTGAGIRTDLFLMAGDNAYNVGTEDEWQRAVFDPFATALRDSVLWPVLGNHDIFTADGAPYRDVLTLPVNGESGGLPSGTEDYYSFDYSNIHFIALDSTHAAVRQPGSAMLAWLADDLAATIKDWVIAIWHHPPYTKGSHDSDAEPPLIEMRQNVLPILESGGVDLVLSGHSHSYERSMLIDGFYSTPTLIGDGTVLDAGSGEAFSDGAYAKASTGPMPNQGAVYSVVGSSGRSGGSGALDHPLMFFSVHDLGSLVVDVDGGRLDAAFLNRDCISMHDPACVLDSFTILKGAPKDGYTRLSTDRASASLGGSLPYFIGLENITSTQHDYTLGLLAVIPSGVTVPLFWTPLTLPAKSEFNVPVSLPLQAGLPVGSWHLVSVLLAPGGSFIDASVMRFELE